MATITASYDGDWTVASYWSTNTVPVSGDRVDIGLGRVIRYNCGSNGFQFSALNIDGTMFFPPSMDSRIHFGTSGTGLTVGTSGTLRVGSSNTDYVNKAYSLKIFLNNSGTVRYWFGTSNGGTMNLLGDPAYVGSVYQTTLAADWGSGTNVLYVAANVESAWQIGQWIGVERNYATRISSPHSSQVQAFKIASMGAYNASSGTQLTSVNTFPLTMYSSGYIYNLSRNVQIGWDGCTYGIYNSAVNSLYGRVALYQGTSYDRQYFADVEFRGVQNIGHNGSSGNINGQYLHCSIINSKGGLTYSYRNRLTECVFFSTQQAITSGNDSILTDCFFMGSNFTFSGNTSCIFNRCKWLACYQANGSNYSTLIDCLIRQCYTGFLNHGHRAKNIQIDCLDCIFFDSTTNNTAGACNVIQGVADQINIVNLGQERSLFIGEILNNPTLNSTSVGQCYPSNIVFDNAIINSVERAYRMYGITGDALPLLTGETHWQIPPSGNAWISEITPTNRCSVYWPIEYSPIRPLADYITSGAKTITIKIYPSGFASSLTEADIFIEAYYLDSASGMTRSKAVTGSGTFANGDWRDLTVSFTAGRAGIVYFNLYVTHYEASTYILVDPVWGIA